MRLSREKQGEVFIFVEAMLWGLFPVITALSFNTLSALLSLCLSTMFATLFFALVLTVKKKWVEIFDIRAWKDIIFATFFLGILYYVFYFFGLQYTSAGNAGIISLIEIFFSYLFFHIVKKDSLPKAHMIGAVLMILGGIVVFYPRIHSFQAGDILICAAAFVAPFGNYFQRKARKTVSSETILFIRSLISSLVIFAIVLLLHVPIKLSGLRISFLFLAINGIFLLGLSKILWIEGIHRISVVKANGLACLSPVITLLFAWILLGNTPTFWQLSSLVPMTAGVILLNAKNTHRS